MEYNKKKMTPKEQKRLNILTDLLEYIKFHKYFGSDVYLESTEIVNRITDKALEVEAKLNKLEGKKKEISFKGVE